MESFQPPKEAVQQQILAPKISVVSTLYYSAPYIEEFTRRALVTLKKTAAQYEFVFVNDGSPDNSAEVVRALIDQGLNARLVNLTRNFGHHKAILTGLAEAKGDYIFLIDIDLEEPPEILETFWQKLSANPSVSMVYGFQQKRKGGWMERNFNGLYYRFFNMLSEQKLPENHILARLMKKSFVDDMLKLKEAHTTLAGVCAWVGHEQLAVPVVKGHKDSTTYNFARKLNLIIDSITAYSSKPLMFIFYLGLGVSGFSFLMFLGLLYHRIILSQTLIGWTSVMVSIWVLGGLNLLCLGIIGIYLSRVNNQVKQRPVTLIQEVYGPAPVETGEPTNTKTRQAAAKQLDEFLLNSFNETQKTNS